MLSPVSIIANVTNRIVRDDVTCDVDARLCDGHRSGQHVATPLRR
jgi:hypothetical protein